MSVTIRWSEYALRERVILWNQLSNASPSAALNLNVSVERALRHLRCFPAMGRPHRAGNTRVLVPHKRYKLIYRLKENAVTILSLHNVSRPWPPRDYPFHD
ncbi:MULTISPECIES: type II toxin-antitoxin system RelE/ParE family toxin [Pandoraea]|uniref:Addiction module toxin RelE n=2 Tax=Pandoraea TaxID=93217 RepID=A0A5E4RVY2_9BURK|nr:MULTISPECIES: type II toxin-antitoxin system RelE/ParE family toxin [Pandoraea]VVD66008.1 addiction module toxin RelE [Pandoraea cepalis]VVD89634.1 addiction module toxin RelE [Pandoraea soli]